MKVIKVEHCGQCPYLNTTEFPFTNKLKTHAIIRKNKMKLLYWCRLTRKDLGVKTVPRFDSVVPYYKTPNWCLLEDE